MAELKRILFYYFARSYYSKPFIYKYNPHLLAKKVGVPENTVRRYMAWLLKEGYAVIEGRNLRFVNVRRLVDVSHDKFLCLPRQRNFKEFVDYFFALRIDRNLNQQDFISKGRCSNDSVKTTRDMKALKKYRKYYEDKYAGARDKNAEILFSSGTLANILNVSRSTANNIIRRLKKKKLIKVKMNIKEITWKEYMNFKYNTFLYVFRKSGNYFLHKGVKISLNFDVIVV